MATLQDIATALRNADAAGDVEAARQLAQAYKAQQTREAPISPKVTAMDGMSGTDKFLAGAGKAFVDVGRGAGQMLGLVDQQSVDEAKRLDAPLMDTGAGMAGNIGANLLTALVPGGNTVKGATLVGAGLSALQPTAGDESRVENALKGGALGLAGAGAARAIGAGKNAAGTRLEALAEKVKARAAADAESATLSARSAAGNAAQNAYRQLEHLRELNALRGLTPEEMKIAKELTEELAKKAQEKLVPAAAMKQSTAQAYQEAVASEADRAAALAVERLSGTEAKNQAMARLKRYGPGAVGGALGSLIFPGVGGAVGGAAAGLVLRPTLHSLRRLAQNPAVQYQALRPIAGSGLLGDLADPRYLGLLGPSIYAAQE